MKSHAFLAALALLLSACASVPARVGPPTETSAQVPGGLEYLATLPAGGGATPGKWPTIVFLHGSGESGGPLSVVKAHGPVVQAAADPRFPFLVLSPHLPAERDWTVADVDSVLKDAAARWPIDRRRIYLTGLSLGGFGAYDIAAAQPRRFAAVAPVAGQGRLEGACALKSVPLWAFHGAKDDVVPPQGDVATIEAIKACGGRPKFTVYPDYGHNSWDPAYADPGLYRWLLAHRAKGR